MPRAIHSSVASSTSLVSGRIWVVTATSAARPRPTRCPRRGQTRQSSGEEGVEARGERLVVRLSEMEVFAERVEQSPLFWQATHRSYMVPTHPRSILHFTFYM